MEEEVIMSVDCHFVLELEKMQEKVGGSRVVVKGWHHKLPWETECDDLPQQ